MDGMNKGRKERMDGGSKERRKIGINKDTN